MEKSENKPNYSQEQVHELIFNREVDWQEIIYDLINTEQLNPWDVDIILLTDKFLAKIEEYEEMNKVRFFFQKELEKYMNDEGFELIHLCPSYDLDKELTEKDWNMVMVGKLIS